MKQESGRGVWQGNSQNFGFLRWVLSKLRPPKTSPARVEILESVALTPRQSLALVGVDGQKFLIVLSGDGISVVHPLGQPHSIESIPLQAWLPDLPASMPCGVSRAETGAC